MKTTNFIWTKGLACALCYGWLTAGALAQDCQYSPPELQGEFYFTGECITNTPGHHRLRTEIGSITFGTDEVRWAIF